MTDIGELDADEAGEAISELAASALDLADANLTTAMTLLCGAVATLCIDDMGDAAGYQAAAEAMEESAIRMRDAARDAG